MSLFRERLHLLTLLVDDKEDLPRIREKTLVIAGLGRFLPDREQAAEVAVSMAASLLRLHGNGRMRYRFGNDARGRIGLEITCEYALPPGGCRTPSVRQAEGRLIGKLGRVMDFAEVEEERGTVKIRAVKWGPPAPLQDLQKGDEELPDRLFADTGKSCLENLREQHQELVRQLEERSRQNEELNRLNAELHQLNRDLESAAAERAISEMALRVAHAIRTPATVVGGLVRTFIKEVPDTPPNRMKIETILAKTGELEKIVGEFEKLTAQRKLFMQEEDLLAIMRESVEILRSDFARKGVNLHLEHQPGVFSFRANVGMLKIALTHLLRNALEACGKGGQVAFRIDGTSLGYRIEIEDDGVGIPAEKIPSMLEPFVTTKPGRMGLGLPIVKQIVEEHQGSIRLESRVGKGTKVILEFPFVRLPT